MKQGIYSLTAGEYLSDPSDPPSLSASIAHEIVSNSPRHAWAKHPKLNPNYEREEKDIFDLGTAAHALLLEGKEAFVIVEHDDWRTKDAKEIREQARAQRKVAVLRHKWESIVEMVDAINAQLDGFEEKPRPFSEGKPEQSLVWTEDGVTLRMRADWLRDDFRYCDDLKTSSASTNPESWGRLVSSNGGDIQAALYVRGIKAVTGIEPIFRWIAVENYPPYCLSVSSPSPQMMELARRKIETAIATWRRCLESNRWPGYPMRTCFVDAPPWVEAAQMDREMRDA